MDNGNEHEDMKPVIIEDKTARLKAIIEDTERQFKEDETTIPNQEDFQRVEILRKLKEDTDRVEYPLMLNILSILLMISSILHLFYYRSWITAVVLFLGISGILLFRYKLKTAITKLALFKNDFDRYAWEGYFVKEMRFNFVRILYLLLFPFIVFFSGQIIRASQDNLVFWQEFIIAVVISSVAWWIFFYKDSRLLSDLNGELKESIPRPYDLIPTHEIF